MKSLATKIAGKIMDLAERERCLNKDHLIEAIETELLANGVRHSALKADIRAVRDGGFPAIVTDLTYTHMHKDEKSGQTIFWVNANGESYVLRLKQTSPEIYRASSAITWADSPHTVAGSDRAVVAPKHTTTKVYCGPGGWNAYTISTKPLGDP